MIKDITIGRYIHGETVLHRLAPSVKIVLTFVYAAAVFMLSSVPSYGIYILFTAVLICISRVPFKLMIKGLKPIAWLMAFTAVFNIFLVPGREMFKIFSFTATYEGLYEATELALRLVLLITGTSLLTLTTKPLALTDGMEKLLRPLNKIHIPSHEIAMMMSIALRFVPVIADEADRLMKAQKSRGADMESGGIFRRARAMVPVIIPLLTLSFKRADDLAAAMDARCYNGAKRTRMKEIRAGKADATAAAVMLAVSAAAIIL